MSSALGAVATSKISLITTDVKIRKLIGVSKKTLEEALRSINIAANVLAKWNNSMWYILLASEEVGMERPRQEEQKLSILEPAKPR